MKIKDDNDKVYEFENPEFECELWRISNNCVHGLVRNTYKHPMGDMMYFKWDLEGNVKIGITSCKLKPISFKNSEDT